jgi:hypothetical protein
MLPLLETGHTVNAKQYIEALDTGMKHWIETFARECLYMFQQDRESPYPHNQNHPELAEDQPEGALAEGNLASQLTRL